MFVPKAHRVPPAHVPVPTAPASLPPDRLLDAAEQQQQAAEDDSGKIAAYLQLADKLLDPHPDKSKKAPPAGLLDSAA